MLRQLGCRIGKAIRINIFPVRKQYGSKGIALRGEVHHPAGCCEAFAECTCASRDCILLCAGCIEKPFNVESLRSESRIFHHQEIRNGVDRIVIVDSEVIRLSLIRQAAPQALLQRTHLPNEPVDAEQHFCTFRLQDAITNPLTAELCHVGPLFRNEGHILRRRAPL